VVLTLLEISDWTEPAWSIERANLTDGYWVLLVENQQIADELARGLLGLRRPKRGRIHLNGKPLYGRPLTRARHVGVLPRESHALATTVHAAVARVWPFLDPRDGALAPLTTFELDHLVARTFESLSAAERRQVAFALAIARRSSELAVFCEPRLDLTGSQAAILQAHMSELAQHACVLGITASLHDARQLGGPHAHLTRGGWVWLAAQTDANAIGKVLVEGKGLRPVAAHLASEANVTRLCLDAQDDAERDLLQVEARSAAALTNQIARVAREHHATISRIHMDESLVQAPAPERIAQASAAEPNILPIEQHSNVVRLAWAREREVMVSRVRTAAGITFIVGVPVLTAAIAAAQQQLDAAGALRSTLTFLITYAVPLGALLGVAVLNGDSALSGTLEPLARFGANRRILVCTNSVLVFLSCAAVAAVSAAAAVLLTSGSNWSEVGTCSWIAALGAATYAAIFQLADQLRRTWLKWAFLVADILLGASALGLSALFPHAHLLNLMGLPEGLDASQSISSVCLGALLVLAFGLTLLRTEP